MGLLTWVVAVVFGGAQRLRKQCGERQWAHAQLWGAVLVFVLVALLADRRRGRLHHRGPQ